MRPGAVLLLALGSLLFAGALLQAEATQRVLVSGNNLLGALGTGDTDIRLVPVDITARVASGAGVNVTELNIKKIAPSNTRTQILLSNGTVVVAGMTPWNHVTQTQDVATVSWVPLVPTADWNSSIPFDDIWSTSAYTVAYSKTTHLLYGWGLNDLGGIDPAAPTNVYTPRRIGNDTTPWPSNMEVKDVEMTKFGTFALMSTGQIYMWGYGPTTGNDLVGGPVGPQVLPGTLAASVNATFMCATDNYLTIYSNETKELYWFGKHGNGTILYSDIGREAPRSGSFATYEILDLECGPSAVFALTSNKTIWVWGSASDGAAGASVDTLSFTNVTAAVQVRSARSFTKLSATRSNSVLAIDSADYVYGWGTAANGQLPVSDTSYVSTPYMLSYTFEPVANVSLVATGVNAFIVSDSSVAVPPPVTAVTGTTPRVVVMSVLVGVSLAILAVVLALK